MLQHSLDKITEFIIAHNPYFNVGYSDVYLDETKGYVHNAEPVFPADNLGNYFYLRLPKDISFAYGAAYDMGCPNSGFGISADVVLVACVKDANNDDLLENLIISLSAIRGDDRIVIKKAIVNDETVLLQELSGLSKELQEKALQRIPMDYSIVSVLFTVENNYTVPNIKCIKNPCSCSTS